LLDCFDRPELRGQTELLREFSASITIVNFIWSVIRPEMHVKGLSLGTNPLRAAEHWISRFNDRKRLAIMIRLDTRARRRSLRNVFTCWESRHVLLTPYPPKASCMVEKPTTEAVRLLLSLWSRSYEALARKNCSSENPAIQRQPGRTLHVGT
jgi:hypothetical protein